LSGRARGAACRCCQCPVVSVVGWDPDGELAAWVEGEECGLLAVRLLAKTAFSRQADVCLAAELGLGVRDGIRNWLVTAA
jgi:hypothetical protein